MLRTPPLVPLLLLVGTSTSAHAAAVADAAAHFSAHNRSIDSRIGLRWLAHQSPQHPFWMAVPYKSRAAWQAWQPNERIWEQGQFHDTKEALLARAIFYQRCPVLGRSGQYQRPQLVVDVGSNTGARQQGPCCMSCTRMHRPRTGRPIDSAFNIDRVRLSGARTCRCARMLSTVQDSLRCWPLQAAAGPSPSRARL